MSFTEQSKCQEHTEVYSRVCGFFSPVQQWNVGKKAEYADRKPFSVEAGK
jgi:ribonucleoside-triphosphate reductase